MPDIVLVTRDELKDVLREKLADAEMNNAINEDMKLVDMLNTRAVAATNAADAAMYMTVAAELAESIALRTQLELNSRMVKALGSRTSFKNRGTDCTAISCVDKNNPGKRIYFALVDEKDNPIEGSDIFESVSNELRAESDNAIRKLKQGTIAVYDKGAEDSANAILAHNDPEANKNEFAVFSPGYNSELSRLSRNLIDAPSESIQNIASDRCRNIRNIAKALVNGEPVPESRSRNERIDTTMMYLTEKARLNIEVGMGLADLPESADGLDKKQMSVLKDKINMSSIYSGENILRQETSASIQNKILSYYNNALAGEKLPQIQLPRLSAENKNGTFLSMLISCGRGEDIDVGEFIDKINGGKPISEEERRWACRQFDTLAENSGAEIRGMLVNGEPVFNPVFNGKPGYEDKAKCVLISSALEGKRIAAVPLRNNGLPNTSFTPSPVTVLDAVDTIKSLWERILEFFGLGRSNRIEKSNDFTGSKRISDAEKLQDVKRIPLKIGREILENTKPDEEFEQKAGQLNESAKREISRSDELLLKNHMEFISGMFPKDDLSDVEKRQKADYKVQNAVCYTDANGKNKRFLGTLDRNGSLTHFMYLYGMTKGYTLDQMLFSDEVDRGALGRQFLEKFSIKKLDEFAKDNQLDVSAEETRKSYNRYVLGKQNDVVKLSAEMYDVLKKQEFTAPDPGDPQSLIDNYIKQKALFAIIGDFSQVFADMGENTFETSDKSAQQVSERATALSDYEYYTISPLQSFSSAYDMYINYLSGDCMNGDIPEDADELSKMDRAAYGKRFLEGAVDWTRGKKTIGDIIADEKLSRDINSMASACAGSDGYYQDGIMDKLNWRYLRRTSKDMDYMRLDPEHFIISRLGLISNNEESVRKHERKISNSKASAAKLLPKGFEKNLTEAFSSVLEQEKAKAPVREKMGFGELAGGSNRVSKAPASSEKQLENEKSMGGRNKS